MLCCDNAGALTSKQHATLRLQCTHAVNYYPKCFNVTGPTNITSFSQFENTTWSPTHMAQVSMLDEYMGNVSINIEGPRYSQALQTLAQDSLHAQKSALDIQILLCTEGNALSSCINSDIKAINNKPMAQK